MHPACYKNTYVPVKKISFPHRAKTIVNKPQFKMHDISSYLMSEKFVKMTCFQDIVASN